MVNSERESRERSRHSTGDIFLYITQFFFLFYVNGPSSVAALFGVCSHLLLLGRRRISFLPVYFTVLASSVYVLLNLPRGLSSRESFNLTESTILALRSLLVFGNVIHVLLDFVVCPLHNCGTPIRPTGPCKNVGQIIVPLQDYDVSCYVRVFYPAKFSSSVPPCPQPYWLHGLATASGLSHSYASVFMPPALFAWIRWLPGWTSVGDPILAPLSHSQAVQAARSARLIPTPPLESSTHPTPVLPPDAPPEELPRLPVVIFSAGLSGSPDMYSNIISEFVSHGCVVLSPEHTDGSAAFAALPEAKVLGEGMTFERLTAEELRDRGKKYARRSEQLKHRVREIAACAAFASDLGGVGIRVPVPVKNGAGHALLMMEDMIGKSPGTPSSSFFSAHTTPCTLLGGALEVGRVAALVGHSFGGATAVAAGEASTLPTGLGRHFFGGKVDCVLALDTWAFPLSPHTLSRGVGGVPILALCGEGFARWRENQRAMQLLCDPAFRAAHPCSGKRRLEGGGRSSNNGFLEDGSFVEGMGAYGEGEGLCSESGFAEEQPEGGSRSSGKNKYIESRGAAATISAGFLPATTSPKGEILSGPLQAPSLAPTPAPRVHPSTVLVALTDIFHQSFSDFATVIPWVMKAMKLRGQGRSGAAEIALIRGVALDYLKFIRGGGMGTYNLPKEALPHVLPHAHFATRPTDQ